MWSPTPILLVLLVVGAIEAAPKLVNFEGQRNPLQIGRRPLRNFGLLQLGGGYGMQKRLTPNYRYGSKNEKQRRGPLNGLIPGGAFGRAARSSCLRLNCESTTYDKFLYTLKERNPYVSFENVENRNDSDGRKENREGGKMPIKIDIYTPYQYKKLLGLKYK